MNIPPLEKRNARITTGAAPYGKHYRFEVAASHPFTQQLDIVFPSNSALEEALVKFETSYAKGKSKLSGLVGQAGTFVNSIKRKSELLLASTGAYEDDAWCIDSRGLLTLSVSKEMYERLGLVGKKLPFKNHKELHAIHLPLQQNAQSITNLARRRSALETWDKARDEAGLGPWNVLYCLQDPTANPDVLSGCTSDTVIRKVKCQRNELSDIHIPVPSLTPRPFTSKKASSSEELDEWNESTGALFEWIGMACLGAQRLKANDRVDPFVALYEPPTPSRIGNATHLRWRGLLSPDFVQAILDTILASMATPATTETNHFVSVTSQAFSEAPLSYIPPAAFLPGSKGLEAPVRLPRADGEDTWSIMVVPSSECIRWSLVESLGQFDTRWG
ncbi:ribonuclease P 40kDa subunit-domain-containing protein [Crucibulum laeve]|uniref:Ribonuclease P 40kDa subunit-domain-containing protein n=1 Tax=Crucibulum laeve TaxID=68775 RepID=A0A5C3M3H6_9AGAR|nr:ribonuclease P 40kDa subunit-domain-containing protein [Crucibulum laeve]